MSVSGKAASFGARFMGPVTDQVLEQFAGNFATKVQAMKASIRTRWRDRPSATPRHAQSSSPQRAGADVGRDQGLAAFVVRGETHMSSARALELAALQQDLARAGYIAEPPLAAALLLMQDLQRPLLLEGDAGVGKTEVAKVLAQLRSTRLIRLQCYEGLDAHAAMYEWNYQRQLLAIKLLEHDERGLQQKEQDIFSERYLLKRPLLEAITGDVAPVLLIDEIDRADEAFEAYLLELLSDFQLSIPELGTVRATHRPLVVITSNGTRELSDALRRRCLYQYIDYPDYDKELAIVRKKAPEVAPALAQQIVAFVQGVRRMELQKGPASPRRWTGRPRCCACGVSTIDVDGAERILDTLERADQDA